jgi:spermidine/putrescine transport system permease protein
MSTTVSTTTAPTAPGGSRRRHAQDPSRRSRFGFLLAGGPWLWMLAFFIGPLGILVAWSFQPPGMSLELGSPTTSGYQSVAEADAYWHLLWWTLITAFVVAIASVVLAYPIAYFLALVAGRHRYVLLGLAFVPFLTSYVLRIFAWRLILGRTGLLNTALLDLGVIQHPIGALLYSRLTVIIVLTYVWVPWAALPIFVRLDALDSGLLAAASDLGASPRRTLLRVVLPLSLPGVYTAFFLVFIPTIGDFATASYVGGTNGIMLGNVVQDFLNNVNYPSGAVLSVAMLVIALVLMLVAVRIMRIKDVTDVKI